MGPNSTEFTSKGYVEAPLLWCAMKIAVTATEAKLSLTVRWNWVGLFRVKDSAGLVGGAISGGMAAKLAPFLLNCYLTAAVSPLSHLLTVVK